LTSTQFAVPDSGIMSGELAALLIICKTAVRVPEAVGSNEIPIAQLAPLVKVLPQVFDSIGKSPIFAPAKVIPEIVSVASPVLVNITV
jgi:hypothetical protein